MTETKEQYLGRLVYRSWHRGCKETDILLGDFAKALIKELSDSELADYEKLLEVDDADIYNWLSGKEEIPETYYTDVMQKLLEFNKDNAIHHKEA